MSGIRPGGSVLRLAAVLAAATLVAGCTPGDGQPSPAPLTPTDSVSASGFDYAAYLETLQKASGIADPPATQMIRLIAPNELTTVWSDCMREAGFDVVVTFDGGLSTPVDLPEDQADAYALADYVCFAEYPVDQSLIPIFGDEQIRRVYTYYVDVLTPCLEARGFQVAEAQTWESFRSSWVPEPRGGFYSGRTTWVPYASVDAQTMTAQEWEDLNLACPQSPSDDYLYAPK